jgi:hypothetical protein
MAKRIYRTAQGKQVDLDGLILVNEETIAVGNMGVNARGDELGPGGRVVTRRNEVMDEYYNTPDVIPVGDVPVPPTRQRAARPASPAAQVEVQPATESIFDKPAPPPSQTITLEDQSETKPARQRQALRGSLADAVAKETVVSQPVVGLPEERGPKRL